MYRIEVFYPGERHARETRVIAHANEVLTLIHDLLAAHEGCERVTVWLDAQRLFAVDCKGNRLDD
jgi:hypothetical protein